MFALNINPVEYFIDYVLRRSNWCYPTLEEEKYSKIFNLEDAMKSLSTGKGFNSPRKRLPTSYKGGNLHFMAASWPEKGIAGHKSYVVTKGKATFVVVLYSTDGKGLLAVIEANLLGQIRTGAASGLASKYLARKDSSKLAIIGSGFQAETQLEAIHSQFNLEEVKVFSRTKEKREAFVNKMTKKLGLNIKSSQSSEEATENSDINISNIILFIKFLYFSIFFVNISHVGATLLNMSVEITATVKTLDRRRVVFEILVKDELDIVGSGTHDRFITDAIKSAEKLRGKAKQAGVL